MFKFTTMLRSLGFIAFIHITATAAGASDLSDPTRPLRFRAPSQVTQTLELNSILIAEGRRFAVVNGQQLAERERIGRWRVVRIEPDRVVMSDNGQTRVLRLHTEIRH